MQVLKENNKRMMETITQFASSTTITFQPPPMPIENVTNVVKNNENGRNGESTIDPFLNTTNPSIVANPIMVAAKPYPKDYISSKFKQFNGKTGDTLEHVMKLVETLGVIGLDNNLTLKEFSKSLTEKAYTWYVNLTLNLVDS
ncbi:H0502G05.11 protein, putative [Theobroma cacao]|uniref:H0502G05.11 protein, putative n=1 Tax=Theobroma cacao TaxID=3641 RepID=A0A061EU74_THECC|nr:H0502G05.11 protein, putative [Theobroma cacao]